MNIKLCRQACAVMDRDLISADHFVVNALLFAQRRIADFELMYDDSEHHWTARGISVGEVSDKALHDVMAKLILQCDS